MNSLPGSSSALLLATRQIQGLPVVDELSWHVSVGDLGLVEEDLAILAARALGHVHLDVKSFLQATGLDAATRSSAPTTRGVMLLSAASLEPTLLVELCAGDADVTTTALLLTVLAGVVEILAGLVGLEPLAVLASLSLECS